MKKVLILSCGTGGGHNSAALAIQESLNEKGIEADFIEYLSIVNTKMKDHINNLYIKSTKANGKVFKVVYRLGELYQKTKWKSPVYGLNSLNKNILYKYIKENQYDYIVTTHLFSAQALTEVKKQYEIHFMQVATDYVCIPFWEETNPDYFIIPSNEVKQDFIDKGIKEEKLLPIGIPVAKTYVENYNEKQCKAELQLEENSQYVLILTGSMGFGNVIKMLEKLLKKIQDVKFIISCGHNEKLLSEINSKYEKNERVIAIPFTNKISEYMKSSCIILTKPGGLTTTEISVLNKPFIHTMPIPGCENYNANFFNVRKMSIKCDTIKEIVENTSKLLADKEMQQKMVENQKRYINKNASNEIADIIIKECN